MSSREKITLAIVLTILLAGSQHLTKPKPQPPRSVWETNSPEETPREEERKPEQLQINLTPISRLGFFVAHSIAWIANAAKNAPILVDALANELTQTNKTKHVFDTPPQREAGQR